MDRPGKNYVSSGQLVRDLDALALPAQKVDHALFANANLAELLAEHDDAARDELVALAKLVDEPALATLPYVELNVGYTAEGDVGEDLPELFEEPAALEQVRGAIGIADVRRNSLHCFLNPDGTVQALERGASWEWQTATFPDVGTFLWTLVHGAAAERDPALVAPYQAIVADLGIRDAARSADVPSRVLPPSEDD
ncbi:MAG: hypothetical protein ABI867_00385 [Kofleriaceae bacterium]